MRISKVRLSRHTPLSGSVLLPAVAIGLCGGVHGGARFLGGDRQIIVTLTLFHVHPVFLVVILTGHECPDHGVGVGVASVGQFIHQSLIVGALVAVSTFARPQCPENSITNQTDTQEVLLLGVSHRWGSVSLFLRCVRKQKFVMNSLQFH